MAIREIIKKPFMDMKESAKMQHEVDKANFKAVKAESKATFEENRGKNTFKRAKEDSKRIWDEAHLSPSKRREITKNKQEEQIALAQKRIECANKRYDAACENKSSN